MATNAIVLIVVASVALLLPVSVLAGVAYKTRIRNRRGKDETIRDQAEVEALQLQRQEALADELDARAHAAQVEIDIKTVRACRLRRQAQVHRSEALSSRDHLNELKGTAAK